MEVYREWNDTVKVEKKNVNKHKRLKYLSLFCSNVWKEVIFLEEKGNELHVNIFMFGIWIEKNNFKIALLLYAISPGKNK